MIEYQLDHSATAVLFGICGPEDDRETITEHLEELAALAENIGYTCITSVVVPTGQPHPRYLIGSGKAQEICTLAETADVIICDDELSPSQQRNWEKLADKPVLDRRQVILTIFDERAGTAESRLQVDLATYQYLLPRLTNRWSHLSRQRGGTRGTKGEGESQLELDRRQLLQRIARTKRELKRVAMRRGVERKSRTDAEVVQAAIVGYTNAGKSSLLNALTDADVVAEDKLFATLDPTTRRVQPNNCRPILVTDTVGFVRKLPHSLVEAFHATLEETRIATFLILVIDGADRHWQQRLGTTINVLHELAVDDTPRILVFNKADACPPEQRAAIDLEQPTALWISCRSGEGLATLGEAIAEHAARNHDAVHLRIPAARYDLAALVYRTGRVLAQATEEADILLHARVPAKTKTLLAAYVVG